jgi:hypothetical protein
MNIVDRISRLFPIAPEKIPPSDQSCRNDEIVCSVAQRNEEGSVLLGRGKILTEKAKERAFEKLASD